MTRAAYMASYCRTVASAMVVQDVTKLQAMWKVRLPDTNPTRRELRMAPFVTTELTCESREATSKSTLQFHFPMCPSCNSRARPMRLDYRRVIGTLFDAVGSLTSTSEEWGV